MAPIGCSLAWCTDRHARSASLSPNCCQRVRNSPTACVQDGSSRLSRRPGTTCGSPGWNKWPARQAAQEPHERVSGTRRSMRQATVGASYGRASTCRSTPLIRGPSTSSAARPIRRPALIGTSPPTARRRLRFGETSTKLARRLIYPLGSHTCSVQCSRGGFP